MKPDITNHPSPRPSSVPVPGLADCSLSGEVKSHQEVGMIPPSLPNTDEFDISVANLPEKLGFSSQFQEELAAVGGNVHSLAVKLLNSFNSDHSGKFVAGQLCVKPEQLEFNTKTLDAGPMVTRWLTSGYEIQFTQVPTKLLSAKNNRSCIDNIKFAREELQRQVKGGILSEVSYRPTIVNPIYANKW